MGAKCLLTLLRDFFSFSISNLSCDPIVSLQVDECISIVLNKIFSRPYMPIWYTLNFRMSEPYHMKTLYILQAKNYYFLSILKETNRLKNVIDFIRFDQNECRAVGRIVSIEHLISK